MFHVTSTAAREILAAAARSDASGMSLRVAALQLADGSVEYGMGFDGEREHDQVFRVEGLTVLVGEPSQALLQATVLDYVERDPGQFDFVFVPAPRDVPVGCDASPARVASGCGSGACFNGRCGD